MCLSTGLIWVATGQLAPSSPSTSLDLFSTVESTRCICVSTSFRLALLKYRRKTADLGSTPKPHVGKRGMLSLKPEFPVSRRVSFNTAGSQLCSEVVLEIVFKKCLSLPVNPFRWGVILFCVIHSNCERLSQEGESIQGSKRSTCIFCSLRVLQIFSRGKMYIPNYEI